MGALGLVLFQILLLSYLEIFMKEQNKEGRSKYWHIVYVLSPTFVFISILLYNYFFPYQDMKHCTSAGVYTLCIYSHARLELPSFERLLTPLCVDLFLRRPKETDFVVSVFLIRGEQLRAWI